MRYRTLRPATSLARQRCSGDTTLYTLTASEIEARNKIVTLQRPCVKYDIKMYVEKAASSIHTWDEITTYFFPIRSAADWKTFRDKVNNAKEQSDVNARLYADISTDLCVGLTEGTRFRGTFDGNGHTVTFNINTSGSRLALFHSVANATIRNLHVKGSVTASSKFAAGLIGDVRNNSTVSMKTVHPATIPIMVSAIIGPVAQDMLGAPTPRAPSSFLPTTGARWPAVARASPMGPFGL